MHGSCPKDEIQAKIRIQLLSVYVSLLGISNVNDW